MEASKFQKTIQEKKTDLYTIGNEEIKVKLTNFGARLVSMQVKDKNNEFTEVLYTFGSLDEFINADCPYYGATIGRYANRIAKGAFSLDNVKYILPINDGLHHLHGGPDGFHNVVWDAEYIDDQSIKFKYHSKDMDQGYPGNLVATVTFSVNGSALKIDYNAHSDKKTVINLTNHAFFNLNGDDSGDILSHKLMINSERFTPVDSHLIPTGDVVEVQNTPFDFSQPTEIGLRINEDHPQLKTGGGYDHNFILNIGTAEDLHHAATLIGDKSAIVMKVLTTEPGLQFYSGNFMTGKNYRHAIALETQHFPDSPNQIKFPKVELADQSFLSTTVFQFTTT